MKGCAMNYIDEFAVKCLRDSARRILWPSPKWGGGFEDATYALNFVSDDLRRAIRADIERVGTFETAFEISDAIITGFINSKLVSFQNRPQNFPEQQPLPETGAPGRPSSMHLIEAEFEQRHKSELTEKSLAAEARHLEAWFRKTYPDQAAPRARSIENGLRKPFRKQCTKL